jgi:hypothetical protein
VASKCSCLHYFELRPSGDKLPAFALEVCFHGVNHMFNYAHGPDSYVDSLSSLVLRRFGLSCPICTSPGKANAHLRTLRIKSPPFQGFLMGSWTYLLPGHN